MKSASLIIIMSLTLMAGGSTASAQATKEKGSAAQRPPAMMQDKNNQGPGKRETTGQGDCPPGYSFIDRVCISRDTGDTINPRAPK
jgi:hypothetical protein